MKKKKLSLILSFILTFSLTSTVFGKELSNPKIIGKSAIAVDVKTGEIIYSKNPDKKSYPASTTKLMTTLLLAENSKPSDSLEYTKLAKEQPAYSLNTNFYPIKPGAQMTADDAMKSLLLYSANDIAYLVASNLPKDALEAEDASAFAKMMNDKAKKLGMKNSHFVTPNGLDDNTDQHYTTAYDMTLLGKASLNNKWVQKVSKTQEDTIFIDGFPKKISVENRNKLLFEDQPVYDKSCIGGKTGYTSKAGRCLVAMFERDGRKILGVVMNSVQGPQDLEVFEDMEKVINYSYNAKRTVLKAKDPVTKKETTYTKGTTVTTIPVKYKLFGFFGPEKTLDVPFKLDKDIKYYDNEVNKDEMKLQYNLGDKSAWHLSTSDSFGNVILNQRDAKVKYDIIPTVSKVDIITSNFVAYLISLVALVLIIALCIIFIPRLTRGSKKSSSFGRRR